ncbi:carbohydrate ABC transporter permease [Litoribacterium kuwaitense]|uniref:carbohydrate ABC transporter permease n=1 Tax=Litoribacterium kuwaitense TaxID=1398745 RepID=UPI0028AEC032|nr:sugar ABC transporter permease [Litoribacterium kuwaitense]
MKDSSRAHSAPVIKKKSAAKRKEAIWAYLFIAPTTLGLLLFYMAPAGSSFYLALTNWDGLKTPTFIGLENFTKALEDDSFIRSLWNTLFFTIGSVPVSIAIATIVAVLLNAKIKGMVIYRTLYFLPVVTMPIAVGMIWRWLYNSEYGLINFFLGKIGIDPINWLFDERFALLSIIIASVWTSIGYNTVIILAGLQGISDTYYEAATLDGAGEIKKFFHITLPLVTPSLFFVLVMAMINSLQVFDLIFVMVGDNPTLLEPTRTVVYSIWEDGFKFFDMGYASAQALLLFLVILIFTIVQMVLQKNGCIINKRRNLRCHTIVIVNGSFISYSF